MAQIIQKKTFGPQGNAKITMGNKVVRVQLNGEVYELPKDAWDAKRPNGDYNVTLSKNFDKILSVRPVSPGTHIVQFKEFGNRTNEIPLPKIQRGGPRRNKNGGTYVAPDKLVFSAALEIAEGSQYDGLVIFDSLTYGFEPEPGTGDALISMEGQKDLERFESFMRVQGVDLASLVIPYSPNVLPWLESYMQNNTKPFMITTNDQGFIDTRSPVATALLNAKNGKKKSASKK